VTLVDFCDSKFKIVSNWSYNNLLTTIYNLKPNLWSLEGWNLTMIPQISITWGLWCCSNGSQIKTQKCCKIAEMKLTCGQAVGGACRQIFWIRVSVRRNSCAHGCWHDCWISACKRNCIRRMPILKQNNSKNHRMEIEQSWQQRGSENFDFIWSFIEPTNWIKFFETQRNGIGNGIKCVFLYIVFWRICIGFSHFMYRLCIVF
jgi:hypothetical protein